MFQQVRLWFLYLCSCGKGAINFSPIPYNYNQLSCSCVTVDAASSLLYYSFDANVVAVSISNTFVDLNNKIITQVTPNSGVTFLSNIPTQCPNDCNGYGDCVLNKTTNTYFCQCFENRYGESCTIICYSNQCGNGGCNNEGTCTCNEGYYGTSCNCNPLYNCSGNGNCTSSGSCLCNNTNYGSSCNNTIISPPTVPSSFSISATAYESGISYDIWFYISSPYQERRFDYFTANYQLDKTILQNFISGMEYNISYETNTCKTSYLDNSSFDLFKVPSDAKLTFYNGTQTLCTENAVEVWETFDYTFTFVQSCIPDYNYMVESVPYLITNNLNSDYVSFDLSSLMLNIPKANFTLPSFC